MTSYLPKIIVVGAGIAGSMAAQKAAECRADVALISLDIPPRSGSALMRDGINAAFDCMRGGDSVEAHVGDTLSCADGIVSRDRANRMCGMAPSIVRLLDRMGVLFNRTPEGAIDQKMLPGSGMARTAMAGHMTGQRILGALTGQLLRASSTGRLGLLFGYEFLSLVQDGEGIVRGVVAACRDSMEIRAYPADAVIICTGGYQAIYAKSRGSRSSDGSAATACYLQGAKFADPEFVQFRPCTAQGIHEDVDDDDSGDVPIDIVQRAYLSLGGLLVDENHAASIPGLFAAGDAACAYHGAGVLAGNEILSSIAGGLIAGEASAAYAKGLTRTSKDAPASLYDSAKTREEDLNASIASRDAPHHTMQGDGNESSYTIERELGHVLYDSVGIARSGDGLRGARDKVSSLKERFLSAPLIDRSEWANTEIFLMRRLMRKLLLAELIVEAAVMRCESRGCHSRPEFPERDDKKWKVLTRAVHSADGPKLDHSHRVD